MMVNNNNNNIRWVITVPVLGYLFLFNGGTLATTAITTTSISSKSRLQLYHQDHHGNNINNDDDYSKWTPNAQYWDYLPGNLENFLDHGTANAVHQIEQCVQVVMLNTAASEKEMEVDNEDTGAPPLGEQRTIGRTIYDSGTGRVILVEVERAITPQQVTLVQELAHCIRLYYPAHVERRSFGEGGGNDCTFLSPLFLSMMLPEVAAVVQATAELGYAHAGWSLSSQPNDEDDNDQHYIPVSQCGVRTSEFLEYSHFRELDKHNDEGSLYTAIFALSQPDRDYNDGYYYIEDSMQVQHLIRPQQYSAMVFLSEMLHGVTTVTEGTRLMFTNEYWAFPDPPFQAPRPANHKMERFEQRCQDIDPSRTEPCGIETWLLADAEDVVEDKSQSTY
jgi:hypothetical protein